MNRKARYPFKGYKLYKVFHKKENRTYACLVKDKTDRFTITLAKYRLSVRLGRRLKRAEQVDHIDGDKTNDAIGNLQILSHLENLLKSIKERGIGMKLTTLKCPICKNIFERNARYVRYVKSKGKTKPCCSRRCGGIKSHL